MNIYVRYIRIYPISQCMPLDMYMVWYTSSTSIQNPDISSEAFQGWTYPYHIHPWFQPDTQLYLPNGPKLAKNAAAPRLHLFYCHQKKCSQLRTAIPRGIFQVKNTPKDPSSEIAKPSPTKKVGCCLFFCTWGCMPWGSWYARHRQVAGTPPPSKMWG